MHHLKPVSFCFHVTRHFEQENPIRPTWKKLRIDNRFYCTVSFLSFLLNFLFQSPRFPRRGLRHKSRFVTLWQLGSECWESSSQKTWIWKCPTEIKRLAYSDIPRLSWSTFRSSSTFVIQNIAIHSCTFDYRPTLNLSSVLPAASFHLFASKFALFFFASISEKSQFWVRLFSSIMLLLFSAPSRWMQCLLFNFFYFNCILCKN